MATNILNNLDTVAVVTGGLFTGAILYITTIESPAMRELGYDEYWRFFPYLFNKAVPLPVLTSTAGLAAVLHGSRIVGAPLYRNLWIASGSVFLAIVPYTIFAMGPINKVLVQKGQTSEVSGDQRKALIDKWNGLHIIRTVSALVGFSAMVYGLSRHSSLALRW